MILLYIPELILIFLQELVLILKDGIINLHFLIFNIHEFVYIWTILTRLAVEDASFSVGTLKIKLVSIWIFLAFENPIAIINCINAISFFGIHIWDEFLSHLEVFDHLICFFFLSCEFVDTVLYLVSLLRSILHMNLCIHHHIIGLPRGIWAISSWQVFIYFLGCCCRYLWFFFLSLFFHWCLNFFINWGSLWSLIFRFFVFSFDFWYLFFMPIFKNNDETF